MNRQDYTPTIRLADMAAFSAVRSDQTMPRKHRVLLNVEGTQMMRGHTVDIGVERLVISVPSPIEPNKQCAIFFGLTIEDRIYSIIGTGQVIQCTGNEKDGFKAEMRFSVADKKSQIAIEQLFGNTPSNRIQ